MKDGKLKSKDFFHADQDPLITFLSKKIVQTGPTTFDVQGDFTIRGATKPQTLTLTVSGAGTGSGEIHGTMVFDRKGYGMNKGIPFVRIGDSVDVTVDLRRSESVVLRLSLSNRRPALPTARAATRIMEYGGQGNL